MNALPISIDLLEPGSGSRALYLPGVLEPTEGSTILKELLEARIWSRPAVTMFGRTAPLPRRVAWVAHRPYQYGGISSEPLPWTPTLTELRTLADRLGDTSFDSVLLNRYDDGSHKVAWHADDEPIFDSDSPIVSISLGATRRFKLKNRASGAVVEQRLEHGSALVMSGRCQVDFLHEVPREARVTEPRINLTFRRLAS